MYHDKAVQYAVVQLNIVGGYSRTLAGLLRVIWAFRQLCSLTLSDVKVHRKTQRNLEKIS